MFFTAVIRFRWIRLDLYAWLPVLGRGKSVSPLICMYCTVFGRVLFFSLWQSGAALIQRFLRFMYHFPLHGDLSTCDDITHRFFCCTYKQAGVDRYSWRTLFKCRLGNRLSWLTFSWFSSAFPHEYFHNTTMILYFLSLSYPRYRVPQKSVNLKHSLVLTGMFRFKPASQFVERYHSVVGCALDTEDLIWINFYKLIK
jgi:hypothetical protein